MHDRMSAHRVSDANDPFEVHRSHESGEVTAERLPIERRNFGASAVAALIERDDVPRFGQRGNHPIPAARVKTRRVREHDRAVRRIGNTPFEITQIDIIDSHVAFDGFARRLSQDATTGKKTPRIIDSASTNFISSPHPDYSRVG